MKKNNGFILMDINEFKKWILSEDISRNVVRLQQHHTFRPDYSNFDGSNHFDILNGMKNYHVKQKGWSDIGQNITTFQDGTIAICRPLNIIPAGIKGANTGSICIEHVGNFDLGNDVMTDAHKSSIIDLNAILCVKFNLDPNVNSIVYHHWWDLGTNKRKNGKGDTKTCPGTAFFGGNSVDDAANNFIPLIKEMIKLVQ